MFLSNYLLTKILAIFFLVALIIFIILYVVTDKIYKGIYGRRFDKTFLHFFTHEDFEGLKIDPFEFKTNNDNTLKGNIYFYERETYKGLVVVSHGLGVGHLQYTNEINHFAELGFKVLSFDNTGCATSEGEEINGLPQGIIDLKSCLEYIKTREDLKDYKKVMFGHSWGGYSTLNVLPFTSKEDNIICAVTMGAPYNSSEITYEMLKTFSKAFSFTGPFISMIEKAKFGPLAKMNTLSTLANIDVDVLLVHGTDDDIVNYTSNFKFVEDRLVKDNVKFLTVENKRHRPNISDEATKYDILVNDDIKNLKAKNASKEELKEYHDQIDYNKLVEFDVDVMNKIDEFILNHFE